MGDNSFAYGLLIGQLSVIITFIIFIRFFIFADGSTHYSAPKDPTRTTKVLLPSTSEGVGSILEKTYYDVETHSAESLDWFTVLIAQAIAQFREDARSNDNMIKSLNAVLNGDKIPAFIDSIRISDLNIGSDYPIFSNCKVKCQRRPDADGQATKAPSSSDTASTSSDNNNDDADLEAQIDVDLTDTLTLGVETRLLLNYPRPLFAVLPVSVSVSVVRFSGTLTVSLKSQRDGDNAGGTFLTFSFAPDFRLEFVVKSLVGARSRLQDIPKIGQFVDYRLRKWFTDRCVEPRYQQIPLPSFWPRSKTTKEGTAED